MLGLAGVVVLLSFHFARHLGMDDLYTVLHYLCWLDGSILGSASRVSRSYLMMLETFVFVRLSVGCEKYFPDTNVMFLCLSDCLNVVYMRDSENWGRVGTLLTVLIFLTD